MFEKREGDTSNSRGPRPFELDLSQEICDRATRLAKTLFGEVDAQVVLVKEGRTWRSRDQGSSQPIGPAGRLVLTTGQPIWIPDGRLDPRFSSIEEVVNAPHLRFYAAAPIRLADRSTPGIIAVAGREPRDFDDSLARCLSDLAAFIAAEWERAQATGAHDRSRRECETLEATFAAVVRTLPVSMVIVDRDYRVLGCSPRWAADLGVDPTEVIGRSAVELRPAAFERWREQFDRVLGGETIAADRVRLRRPGGEDYWITVEMAPWRNKAGDVAGAIVSSHDITNMVEALSRAERAEQRLTLAMDIAEIHVWEMDYVRRELIKGGVEDTFFTEPKTYEELYKDIFVTIDPRDRTEVEAAWLKHVEEGTPYRPEYRLVRADDKEVWTSGATRLITDKSGRPIRLIGAMQNITDRKAAEKALHCAKDEAEAANQAKSAFLATMSHEIRTPLNGVLGMAQAMAADELAPVQRDRLNVVRQSGEALLAILNDILDLSKIEAGKMLIEEVEFDLAELATSVQAAYANTAANKRIGLELQIAAEASGVYLGDCTRVRQILSNLVSNALKFTQEGNVVVAISPTASGVELRVSDSGIGIPAERLGNLFQKFEQVDASTTRRFGGTGLGLAICRELTERLGGSIRAESTEGRGATFIAILPLQRLGDALIPADRRDSPETSLNGDLEIRVLAAEDNTVNQLVLKTLLNQAGIDPFIVSDGSEAVEAWKGRDWDVILMDVQMPVLDGPAATQIIRALELKSGRRRTPVIALTANAMSHQVAEYLAAGMDSCVAKPIQVQSLFAALAEAVDTQGGVQPESLAASGVAS
jgi:PAS domain S-box-containing protein